MSLKKLRCSRRFFSTRGARSNREEWTVWLVVLSGVVVELTKPTEMALSCFKRMRTRIAYRSLRDIIFRYVGSL